MRKNDALNFSTKARTLDELSNVIKTAKVLHCHIFTVADFQKNEDHVIESIQHTFKEELVIVRSSSKSEDTQAYSNAGKYKSIPNIPVADGKELKKAIEDVINSYEQDENLIGSELLIQRMLHDIKIAGVAFTADLDTLAPYYIINYEESGGSDGVTSGSQESGKTYIQYKFTPVDTTPPLLFNLIKSLQELESIYKGTLLDIEFAVNDEDQVFIFQVRPIVTSEKENLSQIDLGDPLAKIYKKIEKFSKPRHNLLGDHSVFGVMPDWNPAEIIGIKPKPLAYSLYKEIITDNIWAYQRDNYGYRNLRSHPLMVMFMGVPFIDVRVDFNSFIPKSLAEPTATKLVNFYLKKLKSQPTFHDKIEFEVVYSCVHFSLPSKLQILKEEGFSAKEIAEVKSALLKVTNEIIEPDFGHYSKDVEKIELLKQKYDTVINSNATLADKIYWLIEDCKRYGTLPFAGIARSAFIATQFLNSLVELNVISGDEQNKFSQSVNTVVKNLNNDLIQLTKGNISRNEFLEKYGHLRPKTYDILSDRYDENYESYFVLDKINLRNTPSFSFSASQLRQIQELIDQCGITISAENLIQFIRESIGMREYAKFVFTKSLSMTLSLIEELGNRNLVKKSRMAYIDIKTVLSLYSSVDYRNVEDILNADITVNKELYQYTKAIKLPSLITTPEDVYAYHLHKEDPNFITLKSVIAPILVESNVDTENIEGKIIFIVAADPGYDYLFTKKIAGLVTQYGGANSHMAVRCAELGIPAVIGAGERNFNRWQSANILELDCMNRIVNIYS